MVIEDVKIPALLPSLVISLFIFGFGFVLQQTPLFVTAVSPSLVTLPPEEAELLVIKLAIVVIIVVGLLLLLSR